MRGQLNRILNYVIFSFLFFSFCVMVGLNEAGKNAVQPSNATPSEVTESAVFVIDPGHGGEDGGASSENLLEKDVNLAISKNIAKLCTVFGVDYRLTREDDRLLYDHYHELESYKGKKKTYDLRNRLRITEEVNPELFVSIHMNKFTEPKYKGLQVYYSPNNEGSQEAADMIQTYAKKYLSPDNERQTKCANHSIYLLKRMTLPAVLVECGFLSNPEEAGLFATDAYREKTAAVIFASILEFSCKNN